MAVKRPSRPRFAGRLARAGLLVGLGLPACLALAAEATPESTALKPSDSLGARPAGLARAPEASDPLPPPQLILTPTLSLWLTRSADAAASGLESPWREKRAGLRFDVSQAFSRDSNVFRFPDQTAARAAGFERMSDWMAATRLAMNLDKTFSRQRLRLDYALTRSLYQNFDFLDNTAHIGSFAWSRGEEGDFFSAGANADYRKELEDYGSFRTPVRSMRDTRRLAAEAFLRPLAGVQVGARVQDERRRYPDGTRPGNELDARGADLVLRYVPRPGNTLALTGRRTRGTYPSLRPEAGLVSDTEYDQDELLAEFAWTARSGSRLLAGLGRVKRDYAHPTLSDFSGNTGQLGVEWQLTPRTQVVAATRYAIGPADDLATRYVRSRNQDLGMNWDYSPKLRLTARLEWGKDNYRGDPPAGAEAQAARRDEQRGLALAVTYRLGARTQLVLETARNKRESNLPGLDYENWTALGRLEWTY
jgi:hypothetical protein